MEKKYNLKTIQEVLSENLKRVRKEKGYSQQMLANLSGMLASTYNRVEVMRVSPTIETVDKIAKALETDISILLKDTSIKDDAIESKVQKINSLNEYNQKVINLMIDTVIEKDNLEKSQEVKMNKRLEELNRIREK